MQLKKNMTSLDIKAWLSENTELIKGSRISNVYHLPENNIIIFKLAGAGDYKYLLIEPGRRINLSRYSLRTPERPDLLAMSFRKYIRGKFIREIKQVGFDRIIEIIVSSGHKLYVELLPRGEIVLVDDDNRILHSTGYKEMKDREIRRGVPYRLPPFFESQPTKEKCIDSLTKKGVYSLTREMGLPKEVIDEALKRTTVDEDPNVLCEIIDSIIKESMRSTGYIIFDKETNMMVSFHPFKPTIKDMMKYSMREYERFNDAIDDFFITKEIVLTERDAKAGSTKTKLEKTLEKILRNMEEYMEKARKYREEAELMNKYRVELEEALKCAQEIREKKGWEYITRECKNIEAVNPGQGIFIVKIMGNKITLSIRRNVWEQIQEKYELSKKFKKKSDAAKEHIDQLKRKIEEEHKARTNEIIEKKMIYRKKEWYEKYRWSITRNNLLVIAGKDASQNEAIVKKHMEKRDIFLHADIHGAPTTILKTGGQDPTEEDLFDAALIAASYSRAWKEGLKTIDVFWVFPEQVSKTPPPGEYLPKGSFMIYGKKNFIKNVPLELTIGIQDLPDGTARYMAGSYEAIKKHGVPIVSIEPGDNTVEKIINKIKKIIEKCNIEKIPDPRDLTSLIPGRSRIKKVFHHTIMEK